MGRFVEITMVLPTDSSDLYGGLASRVARCIGRTAYIQVVCHLCWPEMTNWCLQCFLPATALSATAELWWRVDE